MNASAVQVSEEVYRKASATNTLTPLGEFVYTRTYSRFLEDQKRRERWHETAKRASEYNVNLHRLHMEKIGLDSDEAFLQEEVDTLFEAMHQIKQFLSGRTLWVGGAEHGVADKFPMSNFNCSFTNIEKWEDLAELFYLLLIGTGVGFKSFPEMAKKMAPIRTDIVLINEPYEPVNVWERHDDTRLCFESDTAYLTPGDSKEGWVAAVRKFFTLVTEPEHANVRTLRVNYNVVRPRGERLKTFGGTASGPEPLMEMFEGFVKVLHNAYDPYLAPLEEATEVAGVSYYHIRPVHILQFGNLIGYNVVVGGVRRTAEIFLCSEDDWESILAKYGINGFWTEEAITHHKHVGTLLDEIGQKPAWWDDVQKIGDGRFGLDYRRMSNNSIAFTKKPTRQKLHLVFQIMQGEGEPGFVNLRELARRRLAGRGIHKPTAIQLQIEMFKIGLNPCAEIGLSSKGLCNLTTVNVDAFVYFDAQRGQYVLDEIGLLRAQRLSARAGVRMTLVDLELPEWDAVQKRDRLIGTSLTGYQDAMGKLGYTAEQQEKLLRGMRKAIRDEANAYAQTLRIPAPLLATTVKPEGTLSQVAGGVSSGLHMSHAPYFIRRIRINSADPLAKAVRFMGWTVHPEVGTQGATDAEKIENARTYVIDFPKASGATITKDDVSVKEQFETYFMFQEEYTEHNSSNTITVRPHEWADAEEIVYNNWDGFVGVSFLALDGGSYELAPYEKIEKDEYESLVANMSPFDPNILQFFESGEDFDIGDAECATGACPTR